MHDNDYIQDIGLKYGYFSLPSTPPGFRSSFSIVIDFGLYETATGAGF